MQSSLQSSFRRSRDLSLDLPGYHKQAARLLSLEDLFVQVRELTSYPEQQISNVRHYIRSFNRTKLSPNKSYELLQQFTDVASPIIKTIFSQQHKENPLPETNARRELLLNTIDVCHELGIAYMRLFLHDINLSALRYRSVKNRLLICAHRALELVYTELRIRALRYQSLSEESWRNINKVFFAVYMFLDIKHSERCLGCLQLILKSSSVAPTKTMPVNASIQDLYISLQVMGCLQMNSMATQQIHIASNYIVTLRKKLKVNAIPVGPLPRNNIIIYAEQNCPAYRRPQNNENLAIVIDISALQNKLKKEQEKLDYTFNEHKYDEKNPDSQFYTVTGQEDIEKYIAVLFMQSGLKKTSRGEDRKYFGHRDHLTIFNGFKPCFRVISDARQDNSAAGLDSEFTDKLAQRSALVAEDNSDTEKSLWQVVNSNKHGMLVQTHESQFTRSMFVGQIVLYSSDDDQENHSPQTIGYISRIHRDEGSKLQVAIINLSAHYELTGAQSAFLEKSALALPGVLLFDYGKELVLLLHASHRLSCDTPISILRAEKRYAYSVEEIALIRREFAIYRLMSREL